MTTRQGLSKHKVISSGRLTSSSRGPPVKKKIASKPTPAAEPHYSLYSTDSEDQVTTIHRGLDRCAALLHGILQAENEESKTATSKSSKSAPSKPKPKTFPGRREVERKKTVRKPSCASVSASEQRAISSTRCLGKQQHCYAEEPRCIGDTGLGTQQPGGPLMAPPVATAAPWELMHTQGRPQAYQPQQSGSISQHLAGHQGTTIFNSRLATSTPVLGPQDASPSQPCSSHPMQIHPTQDAALQQFAQHWVIAPAAASVSHGVMATTSTPQMPMAQQPTFRGMPASLLPLIPVTTTAPPAAIANMPAPLYSHTAVLTAPPQQPLQPQHGVLSSRQGMPVPPNPTALANGPQMQHSVNPATTGSTGVINPYPVVAPMPQLPSQAMGNQGPSEGCRSGTSSEYSPTSDEEADGVDITPVRDSDCQAGAGSGASTPAILKAKPVSPQKTAKKVMTVKNLLGELKAMVVNQDNAAVQLINEVENSISLLPAMVGSTNIQAELALALQPLRSENVQLRRRLRILNQQLMERERAEREARPVDCDLEMTSLQSLNLTLQLQLREAQKGMEQVQLENNELRQAVEDKENELQLSRQQSEAETSRIRIDVSDALSEMKSYQSKLESSMMENAALSDSLQQRETEICRLQEIIRNLQGKSQGSPTGPLEATPQLRKHVLEIHQQEQKSTCGSDDMSDSVKNYLQSMEKNLTSSPSRSARPSPPRTPSSSCAQRRDGGLGVPQENHLRSPRHQSTGILGRETNGVGSEQRLGCGIDFAPLKETALAEPPVRMNQALEGSLTSLSQIMDRMALAARGLKIENTTKPFSNNGTTVHIKANPGVLPIPPPTSKRHLDLGDTPASYTGRPSVMDSSISSSASSESQTTNWSMNSCSTFNTRDEEVFRTGMAALDASIARLQRTLAIDLKR